MNHKLRTLGFLIALIIILGVAYYGVKGLIKKDPPTIVDDYQAWSPELIKEAQSILVQDDGRVKPLQSFARTRMLAMHGQTSMKIQVKGKTVKISPTAWLLDVIFRPEQSHKLPTFRIDNSEIVNQLGVPEKELRARYSFNDLNEYLAAIDKVTNEIKKKKLTKDQLSLEQKQINDLSNLIRRYQLLANPFVLKEKFKAQYGFNQISDIFDIGKKIVSEIPKNPTPFKIIDHMERSAMSIGLLNNQVLFYGEHWPITWIPSEDPNKDWYSVGREYSNIAIPTNQAFNQFLKQRIKLYEELGSPTEQNSSLFMRAYQPIFKNFIEIAKQNHPDHVKKSLKLLENLQNALTSGGPALQLKAIKEFKASQQELLKTRYEAMSANSSELLADRISEERRELSMIETEITMNKINYFNNSLAFIILSFLLVIASCIFIDTKAYKTLYHSAYISAIIGTLLVTVGITHRSIIMGRPPIGNLYDTMPFIVATSLIILLLLERYNKKGILLAVATLLGIGGIILAKTYEVSQASDNLAPLRAVLKSNYWLTVHVITITVGYAGGLIAAMISLLYILGRIFGIIEDRATRKNLTGLVYGMIAFTLVFSLIGTILGGIWGADSWGRFWGWDPKENGALLIVIWMLTVLHARLGGYIKEMGLHCCGLFTAAVIVFSWWHVNFLGVGLHNYGFTSADAMKALWLFYGVIATVIVVAMIFSFIEKETQKIRKESEKLANNIENSKPPTLQQTPADLDQNVKQNSTDSPSQP